MSYKIVTCLATAIVILAAANPGQAQVFADLKMSRVDYSKADRQPRRTCDAMSRFKLADITQISAVERPAAANVPAYCYVTGVLTPEIAFEVSMPARWNGRFYMIGNGGHAGESLNDAGRVAQRNAALQQGFAFAQTNTGHDSSKEPGATFVLSNPQKAIDYAYRAVHLTAITAKEITRDYYGKAVSYSYWNSCSNGGRQGLIEAQRFPEDFDGIIANAPWIDQTGFTVGAMWNQRALTEAPVTAEKMALVAERVMAICDMFDGLQDGLIDDPRKCRIDPLLDFPQCDAGKDGPNCLTSAQSSAIAKVYGGPVSNGMPYFPGFMPGSEQVTNLFGGGTGSGWMNVIVASKPGAKPADFNLAENTMRYLVHTPPRPDYDFMTFNFDKDMGLLENWSKQADAKDTDLSKFRRQGGKLLMTYGWADSILQPLMGVNYYEAAVNKNGRNTRDFFRLFMIPGMGHCSGGIGTDRHDPMTAIINWVEKGVAPDSINASRVVDNKVVRTRPLCPYPQVARYQGKGSIDEAENFKCVNP